MGAVGGSVAHDVLLERDQPVQHLVLGEPHNAHPAAAQNRTEAVSASHQAGLR